MRQRIKKYKLESSSNQKKYKQAKKDNIFIYANNDNRFNPKVVKVL